MLEPLRGRMHRKVKLQHYDRRAKDSELQVGDLVMLKVQPRFRLDRSYKGPFRLNY